MSKSSSDFPAGPAGRTRSDLPREPSPGVHDRRRFERGLQIRREVLGADYVDASLAQADEFTRPLQELVTEYCWGTVWAREELSRKTRSLINLSMLAALNRPHELKLHVRGALRNGVSREEIREVLLQVAIYCGVPASLDAFRVAKDVIASEAADNQKENIR